MDVTTSGNIGFASSGELAIELYDSTNRGPVRGAQVSIYRASDGEKIASYVSDKAGQIPDIRVETPPLEYSLESQAMGMPYGQYNIVVEAAGYETLELTNAEGIAAGTVTAAGSFDPHGKYDRKNRRNCGARQYALCTANA